MPFTTPPTFISGDVLTAAQLNVLGDDLVYLKGVSDGVTFSGVQLNHDTSVQVIQDTTPELVSFQNESFDFGSWWSSGTNITVPAGAIPSGFTSIILLVTARARWETDGTGNRRIRPLLNGTLFGSTTQGAISGDPTEQSIVEFVEAVAGDVITLEVYQSSGGNLDLEVGNISVVRYAPAS